MRDATRRCKGFGVWEAAGMAAFQFAPSQRRVCEGGGCQEPNRGDSPKRRGPEHLAAAIFDEGDCRPGSTSSSGCIPTDIPAGHDDLQIGLRIRQQNQIEGHVTCDFVFIDGSAEPLGNGRAAPYRYQRFGDGVGRIFRGRSHKQLEFSRT